MKQIQLSKQKIEELKEKLTDLSSSMKKDQEEQLKKGGLADSWHEAASHAASSGALKAKKLELQEILEKAVILPEKVESKEAVLGSYVTIKDNEEKKVTYRLVHPIESNPEKNLVSIKSPLGKALEGSKVGDIVTINGRRLKVLEVS